MKFTTVLLAVLPALSMAQGPGGGLTYNVTAASKKGEFEKYKCLTTYKLLKMLPKCIHSAQKTASAQDICDYDDYACHCINYQQYSDIIEPLVFPPSLGGKGSCSLADLGKARPVVTDMCNFFNATQYAAYVDCPQCLSPEKTLPTVWGENVVKVY